MRKKSGRFSKLKKAGIVAAVAASAGLLSVSFNGNKPFFLPAYRAVQVFDGDTFETEEYQNIRLASINAPEFGLCGSEQSKKELEKLILNKDIYLKVVYRDSSREVGIVYTKDGLVAEKMLASGWAELQDREGVGGPELTEATQKARSEKRGVFGTLCTQETNYKQPNCKIKANVGANDEHFYHFPGCNHYNTVSVQLHHGDQWFCTEAEAKKAGFVKAERCPDRYVPEK
jgi:endonuclease YncB( thermonuclease family)